MESRKGQFTVVPVLVGALKEGKEELYGRIFSRYLADPHNLFVVSSDFCHWGEEAPPTVSLTPPPLSSQGVGSTIHTTIRRMVPSTVILRDLITM